MGKDKKIAVLLPCYNEQEHVKKVITDWHNAVPEAEIWFCDNNSSDRSLVIAKGIPYVHILSERKQGKGAAVKKLLSECHADIYIMCDVDDTYEATPKIIFPFMHGKYGMSVGNRLESSYFNGNSKTLNRIGNGIAPILCRMFLKTDIRDPVSGLRGFTADFIRACHLSDGFEIEMEMNIHASDTHTDVYNIPVGFKDRDKNSASKTKFNVFTDGFRILYILVTHKFIKRGY